MLALSDGSCPICRLPLPLPVVMLMTIKTTFLLCGNIKHDSVSWCNVQWLRSSQWLHPGAPASRCDCIQVRQHSGAPASRCTCIQVCLRPGVLITSKTQALQTVEDRLRSAPPTVASKSQCRQRGYISWMNRHKVDNTFNQFSCLINHLIFINDHQLIGTEVRYLTSAVSSRIRN